MRPAGAEEFWAKVKKSPTCWLWTGSRTRPDGHPKLTTSAGTVGPHRVACEHRHGRMPSQIEARHSPACEALPGMYDLEIELKPADLEKLFGEAGGIRAAYRMAKAANAKMEAKHEAMEARG